MVRKRRKRMARKRRAVPKDKRTGVNKKYLSGTAGSRRAKLARTIKKIASLYKQGKRVPKSLLAERVRLGKKSGSKKKKKR
jgi:hypothetical protein